MINKDRFLVLTSQEKRTYILNLVKDIDSSENDTLIAYRNILEIVQLPSEKLLNKIYEEINKQVQRYREKNIRTYKKLRHKNSKIELIEKKDSEELLDKII